MTTGAAYADRARGRQRSALLAPRNARAADIARSRRQSLIVSFVGDTPWPNPTVYCDSGQRYDWSLVEGLHAIVVVRPGVATGDALAAILARAETALVGYPTLIDIDNEEVACMVDGNPVSLWQVRRGTELWLKHFAPS